MVEKLLFTDADRGEAPTHEYKQDSGQIRPERFPGRYGSRVPARRKGGTSGMLRPDYAAIRPEQESCLDFATPKTGTKTRMCNLGSWRAAIIYKLH